MTERLYSLFGFDMETDVGSWSPFYNGLIEGTPKILETLERYNISATFFFTGEAAEKHPEVVKEVVKNKYFEVGCHSLYHETVGDPLFDIPLIKPLLPEEVENRIKVATELVEKASGKKPVSFRSPRLWGSTKVVISLEKLGYVADASYPLYYYGKQLIPYHPSRENWLEKGDLKIVEIPNFADLTIDSKDKYHRDRDQWPLFRTSGAKELVRHINNFIKFVSDKGLPIVLCFYFHPWEFIKMPEKFEYGEGAVIPDKVLIKNCGDYALQQLDILINELLSMGATFVSAKEISDIFS